MKVYRKRHDIAFECGRPISDKVAQLREANESLSTKSDAVATLKVEIRQLEASLDEARVDIRAKTSSIEQLQISRRSSDAEISGLKARLQQVQAEHSRDLAALNSVSEEVRIMSFGFAPV